MTPRSLALRLFPVALLGFATAARAQLPLDHRSLTATTSYAAMQTFLAGLHGKAGIEVSVEGTTRQGRALYLVHARRGGSPNFRILMFAQQHGDEVSGKDALLYLLRDVAARPQTLPEDVDLWVMPMLNPDGAEAFTRRNGGGADLNRDHMTLEQPETQALHRVARRVRPHLAVDCHEFTRDSEERRARGWMAWPDITMDGLNNPFFDPRVVAAAQRWVDDAAAPLARAGHTYFRYTVGGLPPDEEQRHSAPDVDGALNALGMYGGLSFIIEAAVKRAEGVPQADLGKRVDAYLVLLRRFLQDAGRRREDLAVVEAARKRPVAPFIPTNYLWVNPGMRISEFPVLELATGRVVRIPTANLMTMVAVKSAVPTPLGYAVEPAAAPLFAALCERHGIPFERLDAPRPIRAEVCTLLRVEEEFDETYARYGGRTIVRRQPAAARELPAGSLWVPLAGEAWVRAALILEPAALYSLYQYPSFRALLGPEGAIPVLRVVN